MSVTIRNAFCLTILVFVFSTQIVAQQQPSWVLQRPIDNDYFIGIANCSKKTSDYASVAKNKALEMLASEISIKLISKTMLNTTEIKDKVKQQYVKNIQTETARELEDFELSEIWQDKNSYWIYYRLSKEKYYLKKKIKVQQNITQANFYISEAEKFFQKGDAFQYITQLFLASQQVQTFTSFEYDSELRNTCTHIFNDCNANLSSCLNSLNIECNSIENGTIEPLTKDLLFKISVIINDKKIVLANTNLIFKISFGEITEHTLSTNNEGVCVNKIQSVKPKESHFTLNVETDFQETFKTQIKQNNFLALSLCNNIRISKNFDFNKKQIVIFVQTDEISLGKSQQPKLIEPAINELCIERGIFLTDNKINAQYIIKIYSTTKDLGESFDMKVVGNTTKIELIDAKTNKLIYSKQLLNVKGLKKDLSAANQDSYSKLIRKINDEVQEEMWQSIGLVSRSVQE